jgi:outer membrane immunogenic protein
MKKLLLASAAVVLVANPLLAADLPTRKSPPAPVVAPAPTFTWTGCYVGAHVGGGWAKKDLSDFTFPFDNSDSASTNPSGWLAGGQAGCDYQFASNWVAGVQGSASWTNISPSYSVRG